MYRNKIKRPLASSTLLSSQNAAASTNASTLATTTSISSISSVLQDTRNVPENATPAAKVQVNGQV